MTALTLKRQHASFLADVVLVSIALASLPFAVLALFYNYAALVLVPQNSLRHRIRRSSRFRPQVVVVTGVTSPAGLRVARALYQTGHLVVGIFEEPGVLVVQPVRWSKAVYNSYKVRPSDAVSGPAGFIQDLLNVVRKEKASLWVDCAPPSQAHAQARRILERKSSCMCITADYENIQIFENTLHFRSFAQSLKLPVVETHNVSSRNDIHNILNKSTGKKYTLTPVDANVKAQRNVLPRRTPSQTYGDISKVAISQKSPWLLEQYIEGLQRYVALAVVVRGDMKSCVVYSQPSETYTEALREEVGMHKAVVQYVRELVRAVGSSLSSHLTVDFSIDEVATVSGVVQQLVPMDARLSATNGLLLCDGEQGSIELSKAYMSVLLPATEDKYLPVLPYAHHSNGTQKPAKHRAVATFELWADVQAMVVGPILRAIKLQSGIGELIRGVITLLDHMVSRRDAVYTFWDPFPAFWLYLFCMPVQIFSGRITRTFRRTPV